MKICGHFLFYYFLLLFFLGGGSLRNRTIFFIFFIIFFGRGVISGLFKVKIQNGNIFWAAKFQIFLGMPDIPDFRLKGGGGRGKQ